MIEIKNISKSFGSHIIFNDFSMKIDNNIFAVFTGESGCGKTSLLNMIGGIEPVDSGEIIVDNINITKTRNLKNYYLKKVGFLFQNFALVEHKTVKENLEFIMKNSRTDITISEALSKVGMEGTEEQKVFSLSGGEQQRIALARLILKQCDLILADEPTGSLDRKNAEQVLRILKSFINNGKTVIMVTHDPSIIDDSMVKYELKKHLVN